MKLISRALILLGAVLVVIAFNLSVSLDGSRYVNLEMVSQRQNLLIVGCILFLAGVVLVASSLKNQEEVSNDVPEKTVMETSTSVSNGESGADNLSIIREHREDIGNTDLDKPEVIQNVPSALGVSGIDNLSTVIHTDGSERGLSRKRLVVIALVLIIFSFLIAAFVVRARANYNIRIEMSEMHETQSKKSSDLLSKYSDAWTKAEAQQQEGPLTPQVVVVDHINLHKAWIENISQSCEAEFLQWEKFDVQHFQGEKLEKMRAINLYYINQTRTALAKEQASAQPTHVDDFTTMFTLAIQTSNRIALPQIEARAKREWAIAN